MELHFQSPPSLFVCSFNPTASIVSNRPGVIGRINSSCRAAGMEATRMRADASVFESVPTTSSDPITLTMIPVLSFKRSSTVLSVKSLSILPMLTGLVATMSPSSPHLRRISATSTTFPLLVPFSSPQSKARLLHTQ